MANYWYSYLTGSTGIAPQLNAANYVRIPDPNVTCSGAGQLCAIYAPAGNGLLPFSPFSERLKSYIAAATISPQPASPGTKIFVYVKN